MMPQYHVVQATVGSVALYPFIGREAFIFGAAVVLIDVDHFVDYYIDTGKVSIRGLFAYSGFVMGIENFIALNIFHTIECYLVLLIAGFWVPHLHAVMYAFIFHHLFDFFDLWRQGKPFAKAFSFTEYFIRRHKYNTNLHRIVSDELEGPANRIANNRAIERPAHLDTCDGGSI